MAVAARVVRRPNPASPPAWQTRIRRPRACAHAQLVMACGTGKRSGAQQVVAFVSSLALLAQTPGEWRRTARGSGPVWACRELRYTKALQVSVKTVTRWRAQTPAGAGASG